MDSKDIINLQQFSQEDIIELFNLAEKIRENESDYCHSLDNKIMAAPFYENSTRTRWSFEAAMKRLGGSVIDFAGTEGTSVMKGETLADTIRMASSYSHVIVLRHKYDGSAQLAREVSSVPIINGGDGQNQHPTQTILDLYTIYRELGSIENKKVAIVGDLKYGRTTHSLIIGLSIFGTEAVLVSPGYLKMPNKYIRIAKEKNQNFIYRETESLESNLSEVDVIYMTRVQEERFPDEAEYKKICSSYIFKKDYLKYMKPKAIIMHPLPRVNEIEYEVDKDPRAAYFRQAENGLYIRMALLYKILGVGK